MPVTAAAAGDAGRPAIPLPSQINVYSEVNDMKTVIFDIGYVLVDYDWNRYLHTIFSDEQTIDVVRDALYNHGVWNELDRGVWTEKQLRDAFIAPAPAYEKEILEAYDRAGEALSPRPYASHWIQSLKDRGFQVLYLSNWSDHMFARSGDLLSFLPLFDGGIFSCKVHLIKPDPAIYRLLCETYRLDPADCVFIDDTAKNVEAARAFGIPTVHFKDYESACQELERLLAR